MTEEPEQMLPKQWVATLVGDEERPLKAALKLEQRGAQDTAGKVKMIMPANTNMAQ
jgi:hypothetical protein